MYILVIILIAIVIVCVVKSSSKKTTNVSNTPSNGISNKEDYRISDCEYLFVDVLDNTLTFIDEYLSEKPDEWLFMNISTKMEKGEYSTATNYYYEEFILLTVTVGSWHEYILYKKPKIKDYMLSIYEFDPSENTFTYKIRLAESTNCVIPREKIHDKLFEYLDYYENTHPNRKLDRTSYGVYHKWNL